MQDDKNIFRMLFDGLMLMVLLCGISLTVLAADTSELDLLRLGSVRVTLRSAGGGETATDGVLTLYQVADLRLDNGNMVYQCTSDFEGSGVSLSDVTDTSLAAALAAYVSNQQIAGHESTVGADGTAVFSSLSPGLYLVIQTGQSTGFCSADPFLVSVPMEEYGVWVYDVDASPKTDTLQPLPEEPDEPGEPEEPDEPDEPEKPEEPEEPEIPEEPSLPQTGQLNWPVWVLGVAGVALFLAGGFLALSAGKRSAGGSA